MFPPDRNSNRVYDMTVTVDKKVWIGGSSKELKLFDLQGNLHRTVPITCLGMFICMWNKQVVFSDYINNAVKKVSDYDIDVTMFRTGDWAPLGITASSSDDLLVCLCKHGLSKVVRYSTTGIGLQEIQYDPHGQPLYQGVFFITENVNRDIIVTDFRKRAVVSVDRRGKFRYSYTRNESLFDPHGVVADSVGHVIVADFEGDKIHMLNRDGKFLRHIISEGGIKHPRALAIVGDGEMIVGECMTGFAKTIKYLEEKK